MRVKTLQESRYTRAVSAADVFSTRFAKEMTAHVVVLQPVDRVFAT